LTQTDRDDLRASLTETDIKDESASRPTSGTGRSAADEQPAKPTEDDPSAITEIKRLGGSLTPNDPAPDKPVISVYFRGKVITTAELERLNGLPRLQFLNLTSVRALTNVDGLQGLTGLQELQLIHCRDLTNLDGLKGLTGLRTVLLIGCRSLKNVNGLRGLTGLKSLCINGCDALTQADRDKLRASLPNTKIY